MVTLESRVARLERHNRALRATLLLGAMAMITCGGVTSSYERVNTNTLVVQAADERPVITLASDGTITFAAATAPVVLDAKTLALLIEAAKATPPATP